MMWRAAPWCMWRVREGFPCHSWGSGGPPREIFCKHKLREGHFRANLKATGKKRLFTEIWKKKVFASKKKVKKGLKGFPGGPDWITGHNGYKPKRPQPKRPQTETATNLNGHRPEGPHTETATNRNGHKPERPQTGSATNRNGHRPERPQTETATSVFTHHISCHQNKYDGEIPIGNDDIHAKLHRNRSKV